jgi:hypothetical protein
MKRNLYYIVVLTLLLMGAMAGFAQKGGAEQSRVGVASLLGQAR